MFTKSTFGALFFDQFKIIFETNLGKNKVIEGKLMKEHL